MKCVSRTKLPSIPLLSESKRQLKYIKKAKVAPQEHSTTDAVGSTATYGKDEDKSVQNQKSGYTERQCTRRCSTTDDNADNLKRRTDTCIPTHQRLVRFADEGQSPDSLASIIGYSSIPRDEHIHRFFYTNDEIAGFKWKEKLRKERRILLQRCLNTKI